MGVRSQPRRFISIYHDVVTIKLDLLLCSKFNAGAVNQFLSAKPFAVLSRLGYAIFLIHYQVIRTFFSYARQPLYYTELQHAVMIFGIIAAVLILALTVVILVEMPFANLVNELCHSNMSKLSIRQKKDPKKVK